jgi:hypothetical protein
MEVWYNTTRWTNYNVGAMVMGTGAQDCGFVILFQSGGTLALGGNWGSPTLL